MKRIALPLAAVAILGAVVALLFLLNDGSGRVDRTTADRRTELDDREAGARDLDASGTARADAARIADLIKEFGGFTGSGGVVLTGPVAPGSGLPVVLRATVDGWLVEAEATTDDVGKFAFPMLPRSPDYTLTIEAERIKPLRLEVELSEGERHDFGDLTCDRYYFVEGRVTGESGVGVKGATVGVVRNSQGSGFNFLQSAKEAGQQEDFVAVATSAAGGLFRVRLEEPGVFNLRATADDYAPHYKTGVIVDARADRKHNLSMTRGNEIVGYVYDGTNQPVVEATVSLFAMRNMWMGAGKEIAQTDATGRFEFRVEPYGNRFMLRVIPPEGIDVLKTVNVPLEDDLIVRLPGTGVLTGKVVDASTQQPVAGAEVLISLQAGQGRNWMPDYSKPVRTDEYGVYRLTGIGTGRVQSMSVRAAGFAQLGMSQWGASDADIWKQIQSLALDGSSETALPDLPMQRGRLMTGTVMDKETRRPVPGATIEIRDFVMGNKSVQADSGGVYRVEGVMGRVSLGVSAPGYATFADQPWRGWSIPEGDGVIQRDIELDPGAGLAGTVRLKDGTPLAGVLVRLDTTETGRQSWTARMALRPFYTYTDDKGRYTFDGIPPVKLKVRTEAPGYDVAESKEVALAAGAIAAKVDIEVIPAATAEGLVVDRDGKPVAGAQVRVARDPGKDADDGARWRALGSGVTTYTATNGRFRLEDVPTGNVLIRVEAEGFATLSRDRSGVEPGATITGLRLVLPPAFSITGSVVDPEGKPMTQCWIRATHVSSPDGEPGTQLLGARVETDGTFTIRNLPAGGYRIEVRLPGGMAGFPNYKEKVLESIEAGSKNVVIALELE
ncbi:MAG: carboxypeptidase regulatory-like domain-containing protein [Planctomycetota bacterium]|jgi:protocatechuate 3,4-dioxygenase beta subunit